MHNDAQKGEISRLAEFQRRHRVSLVCACCTELDALPRLRQELGDAAARQVVERFEQLLRDLLTAFEGGLEVRSGNGASFVVFDKPSDALRFALDLAVRVEQIGRNQSLHLRVRSGIHVGEMLLELPEGSDRAQGLNGLNVDICEALRSLAPSGRILLTRFAFESARQSVKSVVSSGAALAGCAWVQHGHYRIDGLEDSVEVCEVSGRHQPLPSPPPGNDRIRPVGPPISQGQFADPDARAATGFWRRFRSPDVEERRLARWGAAITAIIGGLVLIGGWLDGASYDLAYAFRPSVRPAGVAIVELDKPSEQVLNPTKSEHWDRRLMAQLLRRLKALDARVVAFDIVWEERTSTRPDDDEQLRAALADHGHAVMGAAVDGGGDRPLSSRLPDAKFRTVATWGFAEVRNSGVFRRPISEHEGVPSLARRVAEIAKGTLPEVPGWAWLNYYGPPGTIEHHSLLAVMSNSVPTGAFSNKVVFVGANNDISNGLSTGNDIVESPYSRWRLAPMPGVEVNATSYLNLLNGEYLRRPPPWLELIAVLGSGALFGWLLAFFQPLRSLALGAVLVTTIFLGACTQVWWTHIWLPWLIPCAVQLPLAMAWGIGVRSRFAVREARQARELLAHTRMDEAGIVGAKTQEASAPQREPERRASNASLADTIPLSRKREAASHDAPDVTVVTEDRRSGAASAPKIPDHEMLRKIGAGGYGEVWLARSFIGSYHAVKIIHAGEFGNNTAIEREFRGLQHYTDVSRTHPGLVHILHVGRGCDGGSIFYVMEVGDDMELGQDIQADRYLARSLATDVERCRRLPLGRVLEYGIAIGEALSYLHRQGLIHRDIKPANIIFVRGRPKLADIGLVTRIASPDHEVSMVGTQGYMPPEGLGAPAADVYSLGKALYVAFSGKPVREFPDLRDSMVNGAEAASVEKLETLLRRACEPIVERRLPSADALVAELREIAASMDHTVPLSIQR